MRNEILRKIIHIFMGLVILVFLYAGLLNLWVLGTFLCGSLLVFFNSKYKISKSLGKFVSIVDSSEKIPGCGAITYMLGVVFAFLLFSDKQVLAGGITVLALGDGFSGIFGTYFGKTRLPYNKKKSLEGLLAGFFGALIGTLFFIPFPCALLGVMAAMFVETFPLQLFKREIDDNLLLPLVAAAVFHACFGWV